MLKYQTLLRTILDHGTKRTDRTGVGTISIFGYQERFNLQAGFPLLTTKRLNWRAICIELEWFLQGRVDLEFLHQRGVHIWDPWGKPDGTIGSGYGYQWRFSGAPWQSPTRVDQIAEVVRNIRKDPYSRRHIVSAWNPKELHTMALPPCHCLFQFYVEDGFLSCQLYQRSGDAFLGVPFNIASYALLTHIIARCTGLEPGWFVHTFGDLHLYQNHVDQAELLLSRKPRQLPSVILPELEHPHQFKWEDTALVGYDPHPPIKAEIAV